MGDCAVGGADVGAARLGLQGQSSGDTQGLGCIVCGHKASALVE